MFVVFCVWRFFVVSVLGLRVVFGCMLLVRVVSYVFDCNVIVIVILWCIFFPFESFKFVFCCSRPGLRIRQSQVTRVYIPINLYLLRYVLIKTLLMLN